jgi:hypothetical protein
MTKDTRQSVEHPECKDCLRFWLCPIRHRPEAVEWCEVLAAVDKAKKSADARRGERSL